MTRKKVHHTKIADIQQAIDVAIEFLEVYNYHLSPITAEELIAYFEGEAPSGDSIELEMVLQSKWLLLHELVELSELKRRGFTITAELLLSHPEDVFRCHLIATACELEIADKEGDDLWIQKRLQDVQQWLEESTLKADLKEKCLQLLQKYADKSHLEEQHQ